MGLSNLLQVIGELEKSTRLAEQSIELAEHSEGEFEIKLAKLSLARAYHYQGRAEEAGILFQEANSMTDKLYMRISVYPYCDYLLDLNEFQPVIEIATQSLKFSEISGYLLLRRGAELLRAAGLR